jgi:hypothetical protein
MVLCVSTAVPLEFWTTDLKRWEVSATGNLVSVGAKSILTDGASALTVDTGGAAALNLGNTNATSVVIGNAVGSTAVTIDAGTGGFSIDATGGPSNVSCAGALSISTSSGGSVSILSDGVMSLDTGSGSIETDATSLTADGTFAITGTGANLTLDTTTSGDVVLAPASNTVQVAADNGAISNVQSVSTELTGLSGATATASSLIPAGSLVLGVTARVTTTITGATTFDIGDGSDVYRWGAAIALPATTTSDPTGFTDNTLFWSGASAGDVVLTANGSSFTAGAVRVVVHYMSLTAPTS